MTQREIPQPVKGPELARGKTKVIWDVDGGQDYVIVENTENITAMDDPNLTKQFETKAKSATKTTCNVFALLKEAGLPVAFDRQLSDTEFLAPKCKMLSLEVVARRFAVGSYLKRHPELAGDPKNPHRFNRLVVEFFLKTTGGNLTIDGETIVSGLDPKAGQEDPFITNPYNPNWELMHPKLPAWDTAANLYAGVQGYLITHITRTPMQGGILVHKNRIGEIERLTRQCFLVLEKAWALLGLRLIDFKIEFGIGTDGTLYIADVIDNDSWRLRTTDWQELSKQLFRDGEDLAKVEEAYAIVAQLSDRFCIPKQALIVWKGSDGDKVEGPHVATLRELGVDLVEFVKSGHKATAACLDALSGFHRAYPGGGVIIAAVGRSNGLGPILAAHTDWPVIALPLTLEQYPTDVDSSIRMPSKVAMATVWPASNAFQYGLNILAQSNPAVYAYQRQLLEDLDQ